MKGSISSSRIFIKHCFRETIAEMVCCAIPYNLGLMDIRFALGGICLIQEFIW